MKKYVLGWVSRKIADANLVGHNSRPMKINHSCNEILDWKFVILRKLLKLSWRTLINISYTVTILMSILIVAPSTRYEKFILQQNMLFIRVAIVQ